LDVLNDETAIWGIYIDIMRFICYIYERLGRCNELVVRGEKLRQGIFIIQKDIRNAFSAKNGMVTLILFLRVQSRDSSLIIELTDNVWRRVAQRDQRIDAEDTSQVLKQAGFCSVCRGYNNERRENCGIQKTGNCSPK
jgi:hypothetical protein